MLPLAESAQNMNSVVSHERAWDRGEELRKMLNDLRAPLVKYAELLVDVREAPALLQAVREIPLPPEPIADPAINSANNQSG